MNIVKDIQNRITKRLLETSNPCKLYKTEERAELAAEKIAAEAAEFFGVRNPARYLIVPIDRFGGRFTVAFDLNELVRRDDYKGGYVGFFGNKGFYSF